MSVRNGRRASKRHIKIVSSIGEKDSGGIFGVGLRRRVRKCCANDVVSGEGREEDLSELAKK